MAKHIITGFHAIEERVRQAAEERTDAQLALYYGKVGPRIKKILEIAKKADIAATATDARALDSLVSALPEALRDHRCIVLVVTGAGEEAKASIDFDQWLLQAKARAHENERCTVLLLDSITDPHNVGAILRSSDQFGVSLVVMPQKRGAGNIEESDTIARASAGASAWVPVAVVTNLVRAATQLKDAGFWLYGADAGGESVQRIAFAPRSAIVMGSEGSGISRLLCEQCDSIVSIPTCGKIDSLNVSVATGVLLYETYRQSLLA